MDAPPRLVPLRPAVGDADAHYASCGHRFARTAIDAHAGAPAPLLACAVCETPIYYFIPADATLRLIGGLPMLVTQRAQCPAAASYTAAHEATPRPWFERVAEAGFWLSLAPLRVRAALLVIAFLVAAYAVLDADLIPDDHPFGWVDDIGVAVLGVALAYYIVMQFRRATMHNLRAGGQVLA